jgi:hypothetical protein
MRAAPQSWQRPGEAGHDEFNAEHRAGHQDLSAEHQEYHSYNR